VYSCGCCHDCGVVCGPRHTYYANGPLDFDDNSDEIGPEDE
jgi:hypothetical protein